MLKKHTVSVAESHRRHLRGALHLTASRCQRVKRSSWATLQGCWPGQRCRSLQASSPAEHIAMSQSAVLPDDSNEEVWLLKAFTHEVPCWLLVSTVHCHTAPYTRFGY